MDVTFKKRGIILYVIVLGGSLTFASFYGGSLAFVWLYAILLLIPISIFYTILNYQFLRIYQEIEVHKVTRGEVHRLRAVIENSGVLPIHYMGIFTYTDRCQLNDITDGMRISLDGFEKKELTSGIICKYAGAYNVGIEKISLSDPFGLYQVTIDIPYTFKAVVNPPVTDIAFSVLEIENLINSMGLKSERQYEEIPGSDVRPYQKGDTFNSINWKVSAKAGELMVRLPDKMEKCPVTMVLLADKNPGSRLDIDYLKKRDFFLEFIISAAWHFADLSVPVHIIYPSGQIMERNVNSYESFMEFYNLVGDGIFYSTDMIYEQLKSRASGENGHGYENSTWILIKENPEPGEEFYNICK